PPRWWALNTDSPLPTGVPPRGEGGYYGSETWRGPPCRPEPDAPPKTSGPPAPARPHQPSLRPRHGRGSLRNLAADAPSIPAATALDTSCRHCSGPSPRYRQISAPTAHAPPGHHGTSGSETP